jgi:metal-sulfur cluster biosynthetic enzyme
MSENPTELEKSVYNSITSVEDPELHIPITDLGLVYDVTVNESGEANIKMTLTSMGCPAGPYLKSETELAVLRTDGITSATVEIVWTPPWNPKLMASEDARSMLGIYD